MQEMRHPSTKASISVGIKIVDIIKKNVAIIFPIIRHGNIVVTSYEIKIIMHVNFRPFIAAKQLKLSNKCIDSK